MINDLAFLYLDLPKFNTTVSLIERLERIVDENSFDDKFRNCRHIPIYVSGGNTLENKTAKFLDFELRISSTISANVNECIILKFLSDISILLSTKVWEI